MDNDLLYTITQGTASVTGENFFRALVQNLAVALPARFTFVSEFADSSARVRTLAVWDRDHFAENFEFDLEGTPCEAVLAGEVKCYPRNVATLFPKEREELEKLGAESYLAIPLLDSRDNVLGHLAAIDVNPMELDKYRLSVFRIFGVRAATELERLRVELVLKHNEERLSAILASAKDVIIAIDSRRTITLFNKAAEQIFRCAAAWAMGQPFDRFLSKPFRKLLDESFRAADMTCEKGSVWAPQGLTALRADGEEFPIEATISPIDVSGKRFYTIILRDINERRLVEEALAKLRAEKDYLKAEISEAHNFDDIVSGDPSMKQLFSDMEKVATTDSTVLILGETGTGKELVARAIHNRSRRRDKPLIKMNCAALPSELIESELFGHEKGAFTGASAQRIGRFELAHGGTLFLDEVGELALPAQAKLLRVLQDQEFERVGGSRTLRVDVRVITATNRDLGKMVQERKFRSDLYYRLNVFPLSVPPLRERISDIPLLVQHFLGKLGRKLGRTFTGINPESLDRLLAYSWPGNVRELQNVIERATVLAKGSTIAIVDMLTAPAGAQNSAAPTRRVSDAASLEEVERLHITRVLEHCGWVIEGDRGAAMVLGLNPSTLRFRMQKLGIRKPKLQPQ
jgi:PAS domain S-box-containing protein